MPTQHSRAAAGDPSGAGPIVDVMVGSWKVEPVAFPEVRELMSSLGVSETLATVLVRRGLGDPTVAKAFLEPEGITHDPLLLGDMAAAVERLRSAVERGERICVHGDYDVDGICSTALAVLTLRELGADVGWHLPSRFEEGYGVSAATVARLAEEGVKLILTVDCGITAVAEVERGPAARRRHDRHRPPPAGRRRCRTARSSPRGPPTTRSPIFAAPASSSSSRRRCSAPTIPRSRGTPIWSRSRRSPTSCRSSTRTALSRRTGLRALSRTQKPGLRALMRVAGVDPATVDATAVGFRLAPRLNAAGRLGRPDVGLHLVLTQDEREADLLANELEMLNRDRQAVEERILREAVAVVEAWPAEKRSRRAYVVWGEGWHEGVIGIVASRLVERFGRPVVLIAGEGDRWKGSGRSVPSYDLHAASPRAPSTSSASAGIAPPRASRSAATQLEPFAAAFAAHADGELADEDLAPVTRVDAVVPASALTLELARELERLSPFGLGNPDVTLLVAGCEAVGAVDGGRRQAPALPRPPAGARCGQRDRVRPGRPARRYRRDARFDVAFRLKQNRWNGTVSPQLVVRRVFDTAGAYDELRPGSRSSGGRARPRGRPRRAAIFDELAIEGAAGKRQLLESPTFRVLLEHGAPITLPQAA